MDTISFFQAVILGIVEGLTEFLPVSSTGHLTIAEKALGLKVDDAGVTAFTAVIQMGAIFAVLLYFRSDIARIAVAWFKGLFRPEYRGHFDHRFGWYIIVGSIPIGIIGFLGKDVISGPLRSLWYVGGALVVWSAVMVYAESTAARREATQRGERELTMADAIVVGLLQCVALVPGVSRSGATISGGLLRGLDRVTATRLSFFLSIPALTAAGLYELKDAIGSNIGLAPTVVGTVVSFLVAYAAVAWLLRFVAHHSIGWFVPYRVVLGLGLLGLLALGVVQAT
jgi:undecaprenyl-diphosphatase